MIMAYKNELTKNLQSILLSGKCRKFEKSELVATTEDNKPLLLLVISGFVKRYSIANDGSENIQSIYGSGDIFPLTPLFEAVFDQVIYYGPETFYYETMVDTELASISLKEFVRMSENDPIIYKDLLSVAGQRLRSNIQRLENIALRDAYKRLAHQLLYYTNTFGKKTSDGVKIAIPLTHQDIASVLSLSRETVSREVSKMRSEGIIMDSHHQELIIVSKNKLEKLAYS